MSANAASGGDKSGQLVCEIPLPKVMAGERPHAPVKMTIGWSENRLSIVFEGESVRATRASAELWKQRLALMHAPGSAGEQVFLVSEQWRAYQVARDVAIMKGEELAVAEERARKLRTPIALLALTRLEREYEGACERETAAWSRWDNEVGCQPETPGERHEPSSSP